MALEDYLGYWCTDLSELYIGNPYFCFRIADGVIGIKYLEYINDKRILEKFSVKGGKIYNIPATDVSPDDDGKRESLVLSQSSITYPQSPGIVGEYIKSNEMIRWKSDYGNGSNNWVRPG